MASARAGQGAKFACPGDLKSCWDAAIPTHVLTHRRPSDRLCRPRWQRSSVSSGRFFGPCYVRRMAVATWASDPQWRGQERSTVPTREFGQSQISITRPCAEFGAPRPARKALAEPLSVVPLDQLGHVLRLAGGEFACGHRPIALDEE